MKTALIVCRQSNIDTPLRRSLAHLVKSCRVEVVSDGYQAFNELQANTFDLIIIDSEIDGIDGLELAESIEHIDPGVPLIFMLKQSQKALWGPARQVAANPIFRPFKPITFLRLIDTLLHQQVERYRGLSDSLQSILHTLQSQTNTLEAFLIEDSGQILVSTDDVENPIMRSLGYLAANRVVTQGLFNTEPDEEDTLLAKNLSEKDHELFITPVFENLHLALIAPVTLPQTPANETWNQIDAAVQEIKQTFIEYTTLQATPTANGVSKNYKDTVTGSQLSSNKKHILVPLKLDAQITPPVKDSEPDDDVAVNWNILSNSSTVLNRLHDFCQIP